MNRALEIDIFRGLLLFLMILDHFPGFWQPYTYQPIGFVSAAEFFILLSGFLVGKKYARYNDARLFSSWLKNRIVKLYFVHLFTLFFVVFVLGFFGVHFLSFQKVTAVFDENGFLAIASALLLLYQPQFLDILPTYIVMLAITPLVFAIANLLSWRWVILFSLSLWIGAQMGLREWFYSLVSCCFYVDMGAFDDFAWQFLWCVGLFFGAKGFSVQKYNRGLFVVFFSALLLFFYFWRAPYIPFHIELGELWWLLDKERLGVLRMLNLFSLLFLFALAREFLSIVALKHLKLFGFLGRHSLLILSIHICMTLLAVGLIEEFELGQLYVSAFLLMQFLLIAAAILYMEKRSCIPIHTKPYSGS